MEACQRSLRWEREGLVTPDCEHTLADQRGPCLLHAQPATHQLPGTGERGHSLSLAPGDGIHAAVGQEVRAVPDLHIDDAFFCFRFHELVGDSPHRLTVTPAGMAVGPTTVTLRHTGDGRGDARGRAVSVQGSCQGLRG